MTYRFVDQSGHPHRYRLLRIDPSARQSEQLGMWEKTPLTDRLFLTTLGSGELVLVASSAKAGAHVTGVLVPGGGDDGHVRLRAVHVEPGEVVLPPRVSAWGVTLAVFKKKPGVRPVLVPNDTFTHRVAKPGKGNDGKGKGDDDKDTHDCGEVLP